MSATVLPFEIPLGPLNITGFGIAVFLGFAISQVVCQHELVRRGHDADANVIPAGAELRGQMRAEAGVPAGRRDGVVETVPSNLTERA